MEIYQKFLKQLYSASSTWQRNNLPLQNMLKLSDEAFRSKQSEFVKYLKAHLQTHNASLRDETASYLLLRPGSRPGREFKFYCPSPPPGTIYEMMDIVAAYQPLLENFP